MEPMPEKDLFVKLKEAEVLRQRIDGIDMDAKAFAGKVTDLAERKAPDLSGLPVEQLEFICHKLISISQHTKIGSTTDQTPVL